MHISHKYIDHIFYGTHTVIDVKIKILQFNVRRTRYVYISPCSDVYAL